MKPLRRKKTYLVTQDKITGQDRILGLTQEEDILSDEGSVDSMSIQRSYFLDCGCNTPPAGKCYQCGSLSCQAHHGICSRCQKPICLECSTLVDAGNQALRYCRSCCDIVSRKQRFDKIKRFFLSIFFEVGD